MNALDALDARPADEWRWMGLAALLSLVGHGALAVGVSQVEPHRPPPEDTWVELAVEVVQPPPQPPPEPEPTPEPEPLPEPEPVPKPPPAPQVEPEVVEYTPDPPQPVEQPPDPPPPEAKPVPRAIQGLDNSSFLEGAGTNLSVNRGNTTAARATGERLEPDEEVGEYAIVPYTSVTRPPKARFTPRLEIPDSVRDAGLEGRVELTLTVDAEGRASDIQVVASFHPDAAEACVAAMSRSRWKPGTRGDAPVVTRGVPYSCRFEAAVD